MSFLVVLLLLGAPQVAGAPAPPPPSPPPDPPPPSPPPTITSGVVKINTQPVRINGQTVKIG